MAKMFVVYMHVMLVAAGAMPDSGEWVSNDIGRVAARGTAQYDEETKTWTVRGDGMDIYGAADSFQYVHQSFTGDGSIFARVEKVGKTDPWAKAGVMIRESLDPGSRFAAVYATPDNGVCFQARVNPTGAVTNDTSAASQEQKTLKAPVWIKLERKGNRFYGYCVDDKTDAVWKPMVWKPPAIEMPKTVYIGLAVTSHAGGVLCEARFSNVTVSVSEITDAEMLANPKEALREAYENLEQLGDWRADLAAREKHGDRIASSLVTISRIRELNNEPALSIMPDYYRIAELFPETASAVTALIRIAVLDGEKGLEYAKKRLDTRPLEDRDRFYVAVMKDYCSRPEIAEGQPVFKSFVEYLAKSSRFTSLEQVVADLGSDEQGTSVCKSLIQYGMAQPSNVQIAMVALRYMALKAPKGKTENRVPELLKWAALQFNDTKLSPCAMAALADTYYRQGSYVKAVETFQPDLFAGKQPESKMVENIESAVTSYRANTLLQATIDPERIYKALSEKAAGAGQHVVNLHCQRRIAELGGLSLESFEKSALKGVKYCESGPENEVWFWKGLIAAGQGDLSTATAAYERFLQGDGKSVLAARAYYDIARTKMALGEDANAWIAKAKALSPCDAVIQLERRLGTAASARR